MKRLSMALVALVAAFLAWSQDDTVRRAEQAMADERYPEAIRLFTELLKSDPANTGLRMNLGLACHSAGQYARAAEQFEAVLKSRPDFAPASLLLGLSYARLGEPAKAVPPLERAHEADPANYTAHFELANALRASSRYEEAAGHYYQLVQRNPNFAPAWQGLVLAYTLLAKRAPAAALSPEPACPADPLACEFDEGRYWQIADAVRNDGSPRAQYWRKRAWSALAGRAFANFAALPPTGETHELLAEIYDAQDKRAEAIDEWKQALELTPDSAEVNYRLGEALLRSGKPAEARPYLQKAAKLGSPGARRLLGPR